MSIDDAQRSLDEVYHALNRDGKWSSEQRIGLAQVHATEAVAQALIAIAEILHGMGLAYSEVNL